MHILNVRSSADGAASVSNRLAEGFLDLFPEATVTVRDVGASPLPHLDAATVGAIRGGAAASEAEQAALTLSDTLIAELRAAELILIGSPMYNFGISSTLKAWFDHVLRAGATFRYTESGPEGLLAGRKAIVIECRGGAYGEGAAAAMDGQEPHLRTLLAFIGITDVVFVRAEKLAFGAEAAEASVAAAAAELAGLAAERPALAV